jgi:ABC-type molybdate transport system permease subunit
MHFAEPKNALMLLQLSWSSAKKLTKKLKQMPLLLKVSVKGFKLLRMLSVTKLLNKLSVRTP